MQENNENYSFLLEGMVEKMNTVKPLSFNPFIVWEEHAVDRIFKDRDFISEAKIRGFDTNLIKNELIDELKLKIGAIKAEWTQVNPKVTKANRLPRFKEVKWVIRKPYKLTYYDKKYGKDFTVIVEASMEGTMNTLFSLKYKGEVQEAWNSTPGSVDDKFKAINQFLATKSSTYKSDILQGKLGFNIPYLFIETFVLALVHPTRYPITFSKDDFKSGSASWIYFNVDEKELHITFYQYLQMFNKARNLPKMKGLIDLTPSSQIQDLLQVKPNVPKDRR